MTEGELLLDRRTPESMHRAVDILTSRTERDPASAQAYASLAKALCLVREYSDTPSSEAFPRAEEAAKRASQLDSTNADAHAVLGFVEFFWKWNPAAAESHFKQALTLAPTSALAHQWYGSMLLHQGRTREALAQLNQAQRLEPSSTSISSTRALALSLSGQRSAADAILNKLELDAPEALSPHRSAAYISLEEPADIPRFLNETERFNRLRGDTRRAAEAVQARSLYQRQGKVPTLRFMLSKELEHCKNRPHPSFRVAQLEALLGEDDAAASDAASAVQSHDESSLALSIDPAFEHLRASGKLNPLLQVLDDPSKGIKPKN